ncbi:MAG: hypothetical protein QOJ46_461 [bacterium]|jgi:hypothetical protein
MRTSSRLASLALAASLLAGCGALVVDSDGVEAFIARTVKDQTGARVRSVSCPKDPKARKGATFTCRVTGVDGTKGTAVGTQRDNRGGVGIYAPFLRTRAAEETIADEFKWRTDATVTVRCPEIVTIKIGGTVRCTTTDGRRRRTVRATMTDDQGNVSFKAR